MSTPTLRATLQLFTLANYILAVALLLLHWRGAAFDSALTTAFGVAAHLVYAALYLLPAWLLAQLALHLGSRYLRPRAATAVTVAVAVLALGTTAAALLIDGSVYALYGFHLNGFVWNLVTTSGGIASMGMSDSALYSAAALLAVLFAGELALALLLLRKAAPRWAAQPPRPRWRHAAVAVFGLLLLGQVAVFGIAHMNAYGPVVLAADRFPLYQPVTFRGLAGAFGYSVPKDKKIRIGAQAGDLLYPLHPLRVQAPAPAPNIVWLVAESWRWDMLDPDIMPNTWAFAQRAQRFTRHYSGGNGTRMGLFSMFFGLYGNYWFPMLAQQRGPVLFDVLQQQEYQLNLYTSASFSYPEFDKTIFAQVPAAALHSFGDGPSWQRDRANVGELLGAIDRRDPQRPFFSFMFFESPHARYQFPPENAIRKPYLEDLNYATMNLDRDIGLIKNRYINACNHLDSQFARVFAYLEQKGLLDNTIVIVTGDHGEEFMEKGRWGHNSDFVEEQIRVPLVLWVPGRPARSVDRLSSHLDLPATVLPLLGVKNPAPDYALGQSLLDGPERRYAVLASWSELAYRDDEFKALFPFKAGRGLFRAQVHTGQDAPVDDAGRFFSQRQAQIVEMVRNSALFMQRHDASTAAAHTPPQ